MCARAVAYCVNSRAPLVPSWACPWVRAQPAAPAFGASGVGKGPGLVSGIGSGPRAAPPSPPQSAAPGSAPSRLEGGAARCQAASVDGSCGLLQVPDEAIHAGWSCSRSAPTEPGEPSTRPAGDADGSCAAVAPEPDPAQPGEPKGPDVDAAGSFAAVAGEPDLAPPGQPGGWSAAETAGSRAGQAEGPSLAAARGAPSDHQEQAAGAVQLAEGVDVRAPATAAMVAGRRVAVVGGGMTAAALALAAARLGASRVVLAHRAALVVQEFECEVCGPLHTSATECSPAAIPDVHAMAYSPPVQKAFQTGRTSHNRFHAPHIGAGVFKRLPGHGQCLPALLCGWRMTQRCCCVP